MTPALEARRPLRPRPSLRRLAALAAPLLAALLLGGGLAQDVEFDRESIVVNPAPAPGYSVRVSVDRDPSGRERPTYRIGDPIRIRVVPSRDSYVYLFNVRSNGEVLQILPNRYDAAGRDNFVRAGVEATFPPRGAGYEFSVDGPTGTDRVIAVASREPLDTDALASFERASDFARSSIGSSGFAERFSIVVRPVPQAEWVTDTARFRVRRR